LHGFFTLFHPKSRSRLPDSGVGPFVVVVEVWTAQESRVLWNRSPKS
jgi:hypothetical protein